MSDEATARPGMPATPVDAGPRDGPAAGSLGDDAPDRETEAGLGRRNDRLLVGLIAGYICLLSGLMIARGISLTPDVLLVALGLAAVLLGRGRLFLRDWIPFIGLFFAYELMRGYADNFGAAIHVEDVLALERWLFGGEVPTRFLQAALHPRTGIDPWAVVGTVFYFLHFPLPLAVAFFLWLRRRRAFYDYVAAVIVLSMAGFVTYLLLPVAPPWWAAERGLLPGVEYLKNQGFSDLASLVGFRETDYLFSYTFYQINPNQVAAVPSLHAAYPFLAFLFARRVFGRPGWLMLIYSACVWFSIVYLADHYVVDILAGLAYAAAAYWAVIHAPGWFRGLVDRAADPHLGGNAPGTARRARVDRVAVGQGAALAAVGIAGLVLMANGALGGSGTPLFLVPWAILLAGAWRGATGLLAP